MQDLYDIFVDRKAGARHEDNCEYGYEPEGYTLYSYGAVQALSQAVQRAGSFKTKAVIDAFRSGSFDTVLGRIGFDAKGDVTGISSFVWYVFDKDGYAPVK